MNVSELAGRVGIAPSAVRFYERQGILPAAARRANGYRDYGDDDLCRLQVVVSLRSLGLELGAAARLANLCATGECDAMARDLGPLVTQQRKAVARARLELTRLDRQLAALQTSLAAGESRELCITKGGDSDDELLRAGVSVSSRSRLPVLTGC